METRKSVTRIIPAQPAQETSVIETTYSCDGCGKPMSAHNAYGGYLERKSEDEVPRSKIQVYLSREDFSGISDDDIHISRDYCDECLPGIWKAIERILAYPE